MSALVWILAAIGASWVLRQIWQTFQWLRAVRAVEKKLAALYRRQHELMFRERDLSPAESAEYFELMDKIAAGQRVFDTLKGTKRF
ncbi:MAG: hypothetical protein NW206_07930 [Hyphomonadaceae bacterium]|nr:hypothetical protein [Hyphomonadaceae bacterium]